MTEEPKSIWKKSWRGPGSLLLAWLVLMIATAIIFFVSMLAMNMSVARSSEELRLLAALELSATLFVFFVFFIRWLCCWRNFKRFLFGLACFATFVALFYAEENWRGKRAWDHFKQDWEAKGEKLDFNEYVPPPVPDDQNFAMAPVFETTDKLASRKWRNEHRNRHPDRNGSGWDTNLVDPLDISVGPDPWPTNGIGDWRRAQAGNLQSWQNYYRDLAARTNTYPVPSQPQSAARDVLLALSRFDPVLQDLRQAALLPNSRFPLDYDDEDPAEILLPHLAALKRCSLILQLRAIAELQNDQSDKALGDVVLSLKLTDTIRTEPFIITHLVRIAMLQITLQPVWEGLADHKWSDAQLVELDSALASFNFPADYKLSVGGERAMHIKVLDWLEQKRSRYWDLFNLMESNSQNTMNNFYSAAEIYLMPRGWYYQCALVIAQMDQQWILSAADVASQTMSPQMIVQAQNTIDASSHPGVYNVFARLLVPSLGNYAKKVAYGQNAVNLARAAIALERHRLAHGEFPELLDTLAPQFIAKLPHDIIGGGPLKYRRDANGSFVLYSIGWNEADDGGQVVFKNASNSPAYDESKTTVDLDKGDWIWKYSQK